jgi:hypothetical protein
MTPERILAGDIRPGDRVARTRTRPFLSVIDVRRGPVAVTIVYSRRPATYGRPRTVEHFDRPRATAKWWVLRPDASDPPNLRPAEFLGGHDGN